jgi:hypothetical protein
MATIVIELGLSPTASMAIAMIVCVPELMPLPCQLAEQEVALVHVWRGRQYWIACRGRNIDGAISFDGVTLPP